MGCLMGYAVVGVVGHGDHEKTELLKAMTLMDADTLPEGEKGGISAELGFYSMNLPGGKGLTFIDVPGQEKFLPRVIIGAGSMEIFMLVVAGDEGIMPQTRKHMDIMNLLGITRGVGVITKVDLVSSQRLKEVENEIKGFLYSIYKREFPVVSVSVKTGSGLKALSLEFAKIMDDLSHKEPGPFMRMPVDRIFSKKGMGTVISGTLWSGSVSPGDIVEIIPPKVSLRVKEVWVHGEKLEKAFRGQRVTLNIDGLSRGGIKEGYTVQTPGYFENLSTVVDGELILFEDVQRTIKPLKNMERIRFHHGTAEILGRAVLLDRDFLKPGERGYVQFILESPIAALPHDRYILRTYSPPRTIGGGTVILPGAPRKRRYDEFSLNLLKAMHKGTLEERVAALAENYPGGLVDLNRAVKLLGIDGEDLRSKAGKRGKFKLLGGEKREVIMGRTSFFKLVNKLRRELSVYHRSFPLRTGIPKEELRPLLFKGYDEWEYDILLKEMEKEGIIKIKRGVVSLWEHEPSPTGKQLRKIKQVEEKLLENLFKPVPWSVIKRELFYFNSKEGEEILNYLERKGKAVRASEDICFHREAVERAKKIIKGHFKSHDTMSVGQARDLLGSSRKYVIPLLEHLDREGFTRRVGDVRYLNRKN
ncbi:MAG: selenocysteine-specific translation elongation factor [Clostridia bacterium]|nr:selenocysteine-specific translation elongation factor [Clostridia bacterium]